MKLLDFYTYDFVTDLEAGLSLRPAFRQHISDEKKKNPTLSPAEAGGPKSVFCLQGCFLHLPVKLWLLLIAKNQKSVSV